MLNRGIKLVLATQIYLIFLGCGRSKESDIYNAAINQVGISEYFALEKLIQDTLKTWCDNKLSIAEELWTYEFQVDSFLCANSTRNKLITCIMIQCNKNGCLQDDIRFLYGARIKRKWYFLFGPTITLPREAYGNHRNVPLSFEKMHEIAMDEIFKGYVKNGKINEKFFSDFKTDAYNMPFTTQEAWEASWLKAVAENWNSRDTTQQPQNPAAVLP